MSIYNEDELVPPTWMDQVFFEKVLRQYEHSENVKIANLAISPASMKGDHYASIMFRCKVSYKCGKSNELKQKSLIIKTMPTEEGAKRDLLKESKLFETEIKMYTEALPMIEKILAEHGEPTKLSAEIIYHSLSPHKLLIFEDLCVQGYTTLRERYLNEDEIKLIYRKIAKLHAVGFMLGQTKNHECVTEYQDGIFNNSVLMGMDMITGGVGNFIEMIKQHDEFKVYLEKMEIMQPDIFPRCNDLYNAYKLNRGHKDIFVLNHGDFHMKNMMFKFNKEKRMEDVIMVDYQISCYAPSNVDMIYSQYMLLSPDLRMRRNELMQYYFEEFRRMLKKIDFKGELPLYSDFQMAGLRYRHFVIFLLATFLPLIRTLLIETPEALKDFETTKFIEDPSIAKSAYYHPEFLEELRILLPSLLHEGYFD